MTTLTNAVSGQSQNCSGNLEISPGIGTLGNFSGKHSIIPGHCRKKSGHRRKFYSTFLFRLTSVNENIQTSRAPPRLVVYTNQSETHPTGWAHGWVPHSIQPRAIFTAVTSRFVSCINASNKVPCMVSEGFIAVTNNTRPEAFKRVG